MKTPIDTSAFVTAILSNPRIDKASRILAKNQDNKVEFEKELGIIVGEALGPLVEQGTEAYYAGNVIAVEMVRVMTTKKGDAQRAAMAELQAQILLMLETKRLVLAQAQYKAMTDTISLIARTAISALASAATR